ncbi:MAG: FemAB family PEP-CTERM system-associated protein [Sphingomonadales bacterium]
MTTAVAILDLDDAAACRAWDAFVAGHSEGTVFHGTAWARSIVDAMGHAAYLFFIERGGAIVAALPIIHVKSRLFGNRLVSNAFAVYGGPLADRLDDHAALDEAAWALARKLGATSLEYRGKTCQRPEWPLDDQTYATFERAIDPDPEVNMKAIPRKQRAMVRKAMGFGLETVVDRDADRHFAVYAESVRNLGTPVFTKKLFHALLRHFGDDADVLTVTKDGVPVASVLSLYWRGAVLPYYGGGGANARALAGNDYMYWALMDHARARGCDRFDFGRSKVGTGAFHFKKNWGFAPQPLYYCYRLAPDQAMPNLNPTSGKYARAVALWQKLPLPVANVLGPLLSRGLG